MVVLKNDGDRLPLDPEKILAVAVHGPHARAPEKVMDGDYTGQCFVDDHCNCLI
jgi:beta-glucosidase-like glycosyl hydrolase